MWPRRKSRPETQSTPVVGDSVWVSTGNDVEVAEGRLVPGPIPVKDLPDPQVARLSVLGLSLQFRSQGQDRLDALVAFPLSHGEIAIRSPDRHIPNDSVGLRRQEKEVSCFGRVRMEYFYDEPMSATANQ
jgi:hypothetical protein